LGTYLLDQESQARLLVLDADDAQGWAGLGRLARALPGENVSAYLEKSQRCFWRSRLPAELLTG
jgi:hypothetical protein